MSLGSWDSELSLSLIADQQDELYQPCKEWNPKREMKRFIEFDVLRGVLLLMTIIDHSPSSLRRFTDQSLGFFTTAECFVFISAFLAGMLFRKRAEKLGFAAARSSTIRRAWRIYGAHLVTLTFYPLTASGDEFYRLRSSTGQDLIVLSDHRNTHF